MRGPSPELDPTERRKRARRGRPARGEATYQETAYRETASWNGRSRTCASSFGGLHHRLHSRSRVKRFLWLRRVEANACVKRRLSSSIPGDPGDDAEDDDNVPPANLTLFVTIDEIGRA